MMCFGSPGTGMPQSKVVREMERSWSPPRTKLFTSLARVSGPMNPGMRLVMGEQPVLIGREPEEIALLLDPLDRRSLRREFAAVGPFLQFAFVVISLVPHRVPAGIFVEIDVAGRLHAPPQLLARRACAALPACG